jgi:hypothetical protein
VVRAEHGAGGRIVFGGDVQVLAGRGGPSTHSL